MKKKLYTLIMVMMGMIMLLPSCQDNDLIDGNMDNPDVPEGYVAIKFKASVPDMEEVRVRAVDPDGINVHKNNMTLFCFNVYGLFISMERATFDDSYQDAEQGEFTAVIPQDTYIIHFVANQNPDLFDVEDFVNQTEDEVQSQMEGATGMMIYWGRFVTDGDPATSIVDELQALNKASDNEYGGIQLIRNQAKVSIQSWDTQHFNVTGFVTTNIHAYGTTAPYHSSLGFPTTQSDGTISSWWQTTDFVTLPKKAVMMSDITAVNTAEADYIFEHENTLENPVSVIIRGKNAGETGNDKFYRVLLIDNNTKEQLLIRRNHHYILNIVGELTYGQDTFEDALNAPATNNVWVSVDDWVDEVTDGTYTLSVSQTSAVYKELSATEDRNRHFTYQVSRTGGVALTADDMATVTWLGDNNVADYDIRHSFNPTTGQGGITIVLKRDMGENQSLSGTLMVKKGALQRTIRVDMIKVQKFTPSWISAQIYGEEVGAPVTFKFTIPDNCPETLFPFPVLISTNSLDIRSASGQKYPVIRKGEEGYFGTDYWGYKYEYVVDKPGVHRVYLVNNLTHGTTDPQTVYLEGEFFETLEKTVLYADHKKAITLPHLHDMRPEGIPDDVESDALVHYIKVPQKVNAFVEFDLVLKDLSQTDAPAINAKKGDEFFIYSKSLDYYLGNEITIGDQTITTDCNFGSVSEEIWQNTDNGRVAAFHPKTYEKTGDDVGKYSIYMYTNRAVSEDVIRIASNVVGSKSYWNWSGTSPVKNEDESVTYAGNTYRSVIFEMLNYHPFHFNATVNGDGTGNKAHDSEEAEVVTNVSWDYAAPGQSIPITFGLVGFSGMHEGETIDPLGTAFDVFIDAPMLEPVAGQDNVTKLSDGRFKYTVPANATLGTTITINCTTKKITSAGEIKISSDKDVVVYYDKTFKVTNNKIVGTLQYVDGNEVKNVPKDAFVSFALKKNGTRIGSITMIEDGTYSLNLRSEYEFGWESSDDHATDNRVELNYTIGGKTYDIVVHDLATLKQLANEGTIIVLTEEDDTDLHVQP